MNQTQAQQELAFIKKVIDDSRKLLIYDGKDMIAWGILVAFGMIMMYVRFQTDLIFSVPLMWAILIGLGWVYSIWRGIQKTKIHRVSTFSGKMMATIWLGCGISMTIVGFGFTSSGIIQGWAIIPIMSLFMGIGYFGSATILGMRYLYIAGFSWWGAALLTAFWTGAHTFLIFGALIIIFHLLPGVIFYKRWKKEYNPEIATVQNK